MSSRMVQKQIKQLGNFPFGPHSGKRSGNSSNHSPFRRLTLRQSVSSGGSCHNAMWKRGWALNPSLASWCSTTKMMMTTVTEQPAWPSGGTFALNCSSSVNSAQIESCAVPWALSADAGGEVRWCNYPSWSWCHHQGGRRQKRNAAQVTSLIYGDFGCF